MSKYNYDEFMERNRRLRQGVRELEAQIGIRQEEKEKFLKIISLDLDRNTCMLSDNVNRPIETVVVAIMQGKVCVSNPSVLAEWEGFKDKIEKEGSRNNMQNEDLSKNFTLFYYLKYHLGETLICYPIFSNNGQSFSCKLINADNMGILIERYDSNDTNTIVTEFIFYNALKTIRFPRMNKKNSTVSSLLD